uniref:hypothetical protein n=1 Tax=Rhodococcus erythropolis TaxID=1833 RepID=UPI0015520D34
MGTRADQPGREVIACNGWPLYRHAADKTLGQHHGQGIHLNGGLWYVIRPEGFLSFPEHLGH